MIKNKSDYKYYRQCDKEALDIKRKFPQIIGDEIWKFEILMRKYEFYTNCKKGIISKIIREILHLRYKRKSLQYGISIPINTFGPGLRIMHFGTILINGYAKIGENCRINADVVVGTQMGTMADTPIIGDNCFIGPGAKVFGKIKIGDNVAIGANAVVNKDVPSNVAVAGVPAKIINQVGTVGKFKYYINK